MPQELEDLIESGLVYSAEKAASAYLNRSEHSRFLLQKKLVAKGFDVAHITKALDFLEQKGFLSDLRYAVAWVRNRSIHHVEGRSRLLMELTSRGINRKIAEQVVDEHFETVDQNAFFEKVAGKCRRLGKTGLAAEKYLQRKGFTFAQIKKIISIL
ncbi:MAG: regulatory protein RecX [Spirochaetaceae bacterium]|nr:regulatory protein RecX [Spirochaetaceae bacterium]